MGYQVVGCKAGQWVKERHSKYQWPADRLTDKEMAVLYNWRKQTGTPINYLLKQAIQEVDKLIKRR